MGILGTPTCLALRLTLSQARTTHLAGDGRTVAPDSIVAPPLLLVSTFVRNKNIVKSVLIKTLDAFFC